MTIVRGFLFSPRATRIFFAAIVLACCATLVPAQRRERSVTNWRPLHYDVSLSFNDAMTEISSARTEVTLRVLKPNVTKIDFDFGEMPITSVTVAGKPARYQRTSNTLDVMLPVAPRNGAELKITIGYHGRPKDGLILANDGDGKPSATGDNWPNRVHHWIPTLDHPSAKAAVSFNVTAPSGYQVIANGKLLSLTTVDAPSPAQQHRELRKFAETKPIPPYCMVVAVNQGAIINSPDKSITNLFYNVPHRDAEYAPKGFSPAAPSLAYFSQTIGPYPYEKLALIVGATQFGGMENSSAIVFASTVFNRNPDEKMSAHFGIPQRIESLVAHEIAHQWFGDSVTQSTWADLWLSEGFATYFAALFIEKHDGEEAFREYLRDAARAYFAYEEKRNAPIHDTETQNLMQLLNPNNYEKGAWVLHMLRKQLGDEAFFRGLRNFYNAHREGNATTEDLRAALEKSSGKNLRTFFARWIYGSGHPVYEWSSQAAEMQNGNNSVTIILKQTQAGAPFSDPVPVTVTSEGKTTSLTLFPKGKVATATLRTGRVPISIQIDPEETLLKEVVSGQMEK
ncbi:MAG TPA: M1 family metallopeptidase [Pyrinomonadaceae bacterium]|nr:M1 family metallopeptidase [Pyrinomonadaceae bacterium]